MDTQLVVSASLLTPPSAFQNNSNSNNNNKKKDVVWRSRKRTSGLLNRLYSHDVLCSVGAQSLVGSFPCWCHLLVCGRRVFGNHLLWMLPAVHAGLAMVPGLEVCSHCRGDRFGTDGLGRGRVFHGSCVPSPERSQGLAFVWLQGLRASGHGQPAGEMYCEQSWGPPGPPDLAACWIPVPLAALATDDLRGFGLGEAPRAAAGASGGCPPCTASDSSWWVVPHTLWELQGGWLHYPWGSAGQGRTGEKSSSLASGAALPSSLLPHQLKFRPGVQRMAAVMGLSRAVVAGEWESKHLCAGLGAAASNGFDGAVVVCCLENLHSAPCPRGPRHRRPWRYLNITASRRGVR
ncbi:uncharacterized protein LOC113948878 isoform X1 [Corapipo altera]|uniref:uncharacterized protein LOC113948878 isoform X1 n=1 Tax=Corapipo altera TaxID=415028 RepID=UPI000FD64D5E|nr:uncharacterized protein LOC113948878 isoform X1 [Corapipo altera]